MLRKKSLPAKVGVDPGTEFSGEFRKFCTDKKIKIYSTISETKAAVAEGAIKSLNNNSYCYMEENVDKYTRKPFSKLGIQETSRSTGKLAKNITDKVFCQFVTETQLTNISDHTLKLVKMHVYQKKILGSEKVIDLTLQMESSKSLKMLIINHHSITFVEIKVICGALKIRYSNALFDFYQNNTISFFTSFLPEQNNLGREWY